MRLTLFGLLAAALLAGCASLDDSGLVPGQSTGADVEAMFGRPAERVVKPDGGNVLYYPGGP
ncbi:MAG: outer membrane protein assembly factor BamE, partial [Pseudomonadota bacterium]